MAILDPRCPIGWLLSRLLLAEKLAELVVLDTKIAAATAEIGDLVRRTETTLPELFGVGPVLTAMVLEGVQIAEFGTPLTFKTPCVGRPDQHPSPDVGAASRRRDTTSALSLASGTQSRRMR